MPRGNPSPKLAITVDRDVYDAVVKEAAAAGVSISAWMTAAARKALKISQGLDAVRWYEETYGAFTEEELAEARRRVDAERAVPPVPAARRRRSA